MPKVEEIADGNILEYNWEINTAELRTFVHKSAALFQRHQEIQLTSLKAQTNRTQVAIIQGLKSIISVEAAIYAFI